MTYFKSTNSLAVGDYVQFKDVKQSSVQYITTIENNSIVWISGEQRDIHISELMPVKIDEQWIEKVFKPIMPEVSISNSKNKYFISIEIPNKSPKKSKLSLHTELFYVHQLQYLLRLVSNLLNYESYSPISK